ncbi:hypothetical protein ZEAMMB73_Zm00001d053294 [Zea mays]|uniref:Uncharacterized protein n=1 Tax=Zea mays TaxID=4577 RepID=K7U9R9_MAIZE|nr:hypothetical protein ZEAMMB73_Zm00001d053294 [Zea mays]
MGALTVAPQLSSAPKGKIAGKKVQVDERFTEITKIVLRLYPLYLGVFNKYENKSSRILIELDDQKVAWTIWKKIQLESSVLDSKSAMRVTVLSHSPHLLFFTREKELATVKINLADVEIIASLIYRFLGIIIESYETSISQGDEEI